MTFRVLTASFAHETNTFIEFETSIANFEQHSYLHTPDEIYRKHHGTKTALGSTYELGDYYGWEVEAAVEAVANPSGKVSADAFNVIAGYILSASQQGNVDGVILHLHGAMVSTCHEDAEGELLRRLREVIGYEVPVIVTLDLHGNISDLMVHHSDCLIAVRTYPHIDFYERGLQAGHLLQRCMKREVKLRTMLCKVPCIGGCDGGRTQVGPMVELLRRADQIEQAGEALVVSICAGFTAADIYDIGPSVTVTVDVTGEEERGKDSPSVARALSLANALGEYIWETKEYCSLDILSIDDAVALAVATENDSVGVSGSSSEPGCGRVGGALVMADVSDNPGSGHHGDTTALLQALIKADLRHTVAFFAIFDPDAVRQGEAIGEGQFGSITLGGRRAPHLGGGPLQLTGKVEFLGDSPEWSSDNAHPLCGPMAQHCAPTGKCMRFSVNDGRFDICVTSNNGQAFDIGQLTAMG